MATKKKKAAKKSAKKSTKKSAKKPAKKRSRRTPKLSGAQLSRYRALKNQLKREFYASVK